MLYKLSLIFFSLFLLSCSNKIVKINPSSKHQEFSQIDTNEDSKISPKEFELASSADGAIDALGPSMAFVLILFLIILFCFLARRVSFKND
tara:strand:- start:3468 stop:3740 length:273 start_codon:yes stop_codon:yes gene_type:complete